jgi:hypothetical protein
MLSHFAESVLTPSLISVRRLSSSPAPVTLTFTARRSWHASRGAASALAVDCTHYSV